MTSKLLFGRYTTKAATSSQDRLIDLGCNSNILGICANPLLPSSTARACECSITTRRSQKRRNQRPDGCLMSFFAKTIGLVPYCRSAGNWLAWSRRYTPPIRRIQRSISTACPSVLLYRFADFEDVRNVVEAADPPRPDAFAKQWVQISQAVNHRPYESQQGTLHSPFLL